MRLHLEADLGTGRKPARSGPQRRTSQLRESNDGQATRSRITSTSGHTSGARKSGASSGSRRNWTAARRG